MPRSLWPGGWDAAATTAGSYSWICATAPAWCRLCATPNFRLKPAETADELRQEWVVQVKGHVRRRPAGSENPLMSTGDIEVMATSVAVLNRALTPPFYIADDAGADESLRLRYRYLDLRRPAMQHNLMLRHRVVKYIPRFFGRPRLSGDRDADTNQKHAGGGAGFLGA